MFKSKPIGWITALTLLAVAGIALACRLKEGAGQPVQGGDVALSQADTPAPPVPLAAEPGPLPPPLPETPPLPTKPAVGEEVHAALPPLPEPATKEKMPSVPAPAAPPADLVAVPPPLPLNAKLDSDKKKEPVAAPSPVPEVKKEDAVPAIPVATVPPPEATTIPAVKKVEEPATSVPPIPAAAKEPRVPPAAEVAPAKSAEPSVPATFNGFGTVGSPAFPEYKTYWASQGESLRDVARKTLGQEDRSREIEKLNPRCTRTMIPSGTMVRLPGDAQSSGIKQVGGQADTGYVTAALKSGLSGVKPVPVIRAKPEDRMKGQALMGTYECKLDDKGGIVLPKEVCEQLGKCEMVHLTPGQDACLWLVSQEGAARMLHRVEKAQIGDAEVQAFKRLYFSQTEKAGLDTAGWFKMPEKLAGFSGITGSVVLIGMDDHFEVWDAARWQRYSQQKSSMTKSSAGVD